MCNPIYCPHANKKWKSKRTNTTLHEYSVPQKTSGQLNSTTTFNTDTCICQVFSASEMETRTNQGLVRGHAYSIIGLAEVLENFDFNCI